MTTDPSKTMLRRIEQYKDRWSSFGSSTGLIWISEKPTVEELRAIDIFEEFDDAFLERLSPDVSIALWREDVVLFEQGSYLDLAFLVAEGEVDVFVEGQGRRPAAPTFEPDATVAMRLPDLAASSQDDAPDGEHGSATMVTRLDTQLHRAAEAASAHHIPMLATMDFDLPMGRAARLGPGEMFGEIGALSGWPQSVTARTVGGCRLVQIRLPALRLVKRRSKLLRQRIDAAYRNRSLIFQLQRTPLFAHCGDDVLQRLREEVELVSLEPGETLVREGERADDLFLVRSGFVKLLQRVGSGEMVVSYLSKGRTLGEVELLLPDVDSWQVSAVSVEHAEIVRIPRRVLETVLADEPEVQEALWQTATQRIAETGASRRDLARSRFTQIALDRGLVQGTSLLVIDLERCTRCDDCVRACAATHDDRPRFVREGDKVGNLLVPRSCYHCLDPVCLVGCPTGAIHRAGVGDAVEVTEEICIGCSTCANNCPYDAIVMHDTGESWPDDMVPSALRGEPRLVASKCDLCHDSGHGPACVSNCPQACAFRVGSLEELQELLGDES